MPSRVSAWLGSPSPAWSPATLPDDHLFLLEEDYLLALLDAEGALVDDFVERITHPQTG